MGGDAQCNGFGTDVTPDPATPVVDAGDLQFDIVPAKAVKGAVVSGLKNPIDSNPLQWDDVDTGGAAVAIANGGLVGGGDFRVEETSAGSGKFQLVVDDLRSALIGVVRKQLVLMSHTKLTAQTLPPILMVT